MYRKLLFFFPWLIIYRFGELDWHTEELPETGVCSWEKGMERLPPDWHHCLELAISYLGTFIFWELLSANNTASHLFLSLVVADCLYLSLQNKTRNLPKNLPKNLKKTLSPKSKQNLSYRLLSVSQKTWGLKIKFCFLEVGIHSHLYFKKQWSTLRTCDLNERLKIRMTFWGPKYLFRIVSVLDCC